MLIAGRSRRELARTLNTAYAGGLLSEDTFLRRTDQLLGGGVIDPARLVGDLNLRARRRRLADGLIAAAVLIGRVRALSGAGAPRSPALLALDWSGAVGELMIGRDGSCDIVLGDIEVSRRHARLVFRDGRWIIRDLASTNGTTVNGVRVGRCELRPGDDLAIAGHHHTID